MPKAEHEASEWQAAMEALILVATLGGPTMFARIGIMRALRHRGECLSTQRACISCRKPPAAQPSPRPPRIAYRADCNSDGRWIWKNHCRMAQVASRPLPISV